MQFEDVIKYFKNMSVSILMMLLLTYGMATNNPYLQPMWIIIIVLALQFGYQIIKSARSKGIMEANMQEAARTKKGTPLFQASENDVKKAKANSKGTGEIATGQKMMIMLIVPLGIYIGSGYLLSMLIPGIEQWKSYLTGFVLSLVVSTVLTFKMNVLPGAMAVTPNAYIIGERGIAFENMGQGFIMRFPLKKLNVQKEKNFIEVEGKNEAPVIPNKLKLFSENIDKLEKILAKRIVIQN